jgi:hypothetical protein
MDQLDTVSNRSINVILQRMIASLPRALDDLCILQAHFSDFLCLVLPV